MSLAAGSRLGPYEIVAPLGAGGIGEVDRAKDTKLDREVARVLPEKLAAAVDLLARFEWKAKQGQTLGSDHCDITMVFKR